MGKNFDSVSLLSILFLQIFMAGFIFACLKFNVDETSHGCQSPHQRFVHFSVHFLATFYIWLIFI